MCFGGENVVKDGCKEVENGESTAIYLLVAKDSEEALRKLRVSAAMARRDFTVQEGPCKTTKRQMVNLLKYVKTHFL